MDETYWAVFQVLTFLSLDDTLVWEMKAIEQYFHVILFIMLYKVVLTFKSAERTPVCDHSNEIYEAVL